jgi:hypothetical protein
MRVPQPNRETRFGRSFARGHSPSLNLRGDLQMLKTISLSALLGAFAMMVSGGAHAAPSPSALSAIGAAEWSAKNLDAAMELYAPKAVLLPAAGASWEGLAAIRKNCGGLQA